MTEGGLSLLLLLLFVFGCIFWLPSNAIDLRAQESMFPLVGVCLFVSCLIYRQNQPAGLLLAFIVLYGLATFTPDAMRFMAEAFGFGVLYYLVSARRREIEFHKTLIYNMLCVFALFNVLWLVLQSQEIFIFFKPKPGAENFETGFFANRNEVSVFLAATLPFFFRGKWHWGAVPVIVGLCIAQTMNGVIGAALVISAYVAILLVREGVSKKIVAGLAVCLAASCIFAYGAFIHAGGYSSRIEAFSKAAELVYEKPLLGWGVNQGRYVVPLYLNGDRQDRRYLAHAYSRVFYHEDFKRAYIANPDRVSDSKKWIHLHNDYLQWTVDAGLVGLFLLLWVVVSHARLFLRKPDLLVGLSLLALLWSANAFFTFQIGRFAFLAVFLLATIPGDRDVGC